MFLFYWFVDMIDDVSFEILLENVLLTHLVEDLEFDFLLLVHLWNALGYFTHLRHVVGHDHTGEGLDKDEH